MADSVMNPSLLSSPRTIDSTSVRGWAIATRGSQDHPLCLSEAQRSPLLLQLEPYIGDFLLPVDLRLQKPFRAVCHHTYSKEDSYTTPRFLRRLPEIPPHSFFLLAEDTTGYTCLWCLSHADQVVELLPLDDNTILCKATSGTSRRANKRRPALICVKGQDPYATLKQATSMALQVTRGRGKLYCDKPTPPPWLRCLGWNSRLYCGCSPTHEQIIKAVRSLRKEGQSPTYVMIEEGWQQLAVNAKDRLLRPCLAGFDADSKRFPYGLRGLVEALHQLGVTQIGVWHAMMGARHGIHPDIARRYNLPPDDQGRFFLGYHLGQTFEFFCDYYGYLREQGVTFVKVGDQTSPRSYCREGMDLTHLHQNVQVSLQGAAGIHFNIGHLNTDCLHSENLLYWTTSAIARAAEDIDTTNPVGIARSIRNNLSNALWLHSLMLPDFDAWCTNGDPHDLLATFHALSGSLLTVGDAPGTTLKATLEKMVLPSGKVMSADAPLTLCRDSIFSNPLEEKQVYKAFTHKGNTGVVAAFNLSAGRQTLHGDVVSTNIERLQGERFAVYSHLHGFVAIVRAGEAIAITLKAKQSDIFVFAPVIHGVAVVGCHHLFLPPGPIQKVVIEEESVHIASLIAAPLLLYCERQVLEVRCNDQVIPWAYDSKRYLLSLDERTHIEENPSMYSILFEA